MGGAGETVKGDGRRSDLWLYALLAAAVLLAVVLTARFIVELVGG